MKTAYFARFSSICFLYILPSLASAQPYVISSDGLEVTDQASGLIWQRCIQGMNWNGTTCVNTSSACANVSATTPATFTHQEALQCASTISAATNTHWRLPNIKELASIGSISISNPVIDATAFPAKPASVYWSSSPFVGDPSLAWGMVFSDGIVGMRTRVSAFYVRLVRGAQ